MGFFFLNKKDRIDKEGWRSGRKQKGGDDMGMMRGVGDKGLRLSDGVSRCACTSAASFSCHLVLILPQFLIFLLQCKCVTKKRKVSLLVYIGGKF